MISISGRYTSGEVVKNLSSRGIGILLEKSKNNPEYWKVLCKSGVETWFVHNIRRCSDAIENESESTI